MTEQTYHIHIRGMVQGVGFRPFVYKLAQAHRLNGWVNNTNDGVHIKLNAAASAAEAFMQDVLEQAPTHAIITGHSLQRVPHETFSDFRIVHSQSSTEGELLLTPDFGMCAKCKADIQHPADRRFQYAFTTCTHCGPRYSIIHDLPYDRERTAMAAFEMCPACRAEYDDVEDRRYYSQTNSCPQCAVELSLYDSAQQVYQAGDMLAATVKAWEAGKIVAIKGIGGYLLTCNAEDRTAIHTLRERKRRPSKPLALMYHDLLIMAEDLEVGAADMVALQQPAAPIVLLTLKSDPLSAIPFEEVAPGLSRVGAMLPYTPLYDMLLRQFGRPIVATSGNLSGSPIIYENDKAVEYLSPIADLILANNRDIVVPQDDSVLNHTPMQRQPIVMRRSRGLAPNTLQQVGEATLLATGASLKSSFAYAAHRNVYLSQYLGDTENYESQRSYEGVLQHFLQLFGKQPEAVACDLHPAYFSTQKAEALAKEWAVPLVKVQHHIAHFYALLGEHQLLDDPAPMLGFIWDGTGLGDDGQVWGGECFRYEKGKVHRHSHVDYFDFVLGDKMPKEPRISALAIAHSLPEAQSILQPLFTEAEWGIYHKLLQQGNHLQSSSVGRLFDAAAALLLDIGRQSYEGEAAMRLEAQAHHYFRMNFPRRELSYLNEQELPAHFPRFLLRQLLKGKAAGIETPVLSARFHLTLADYVGRVAEQSGVERLGFSGGVFQNAWLVDLIQRFWKGQFELYFHSSLPPNDENVAFGQLMYLYHKQS